MYSMIQTMKGILNTMFSVLLHQSLIIEVVRMTSGRSPNRLDWACSQRHHCVSRQADGSTYTRLPQSLVLDVLTRSSASAGKQTAIRVRGNRDAWRWRPPWRATTSSHHW